MPSIKKNTLERSGATKRSVRSRAAAEVIDMKGEEIDKLQKAENTAMRRILKAPKWAAQAAIRGEIGISNMKSRISRSRLLYLRRI